MLRTRPDGQYRCEARREHDQRPMTGMRGRRRDDSQRTHAPCATAQLLRPIPRADEVRLGDAQRLTNGSVPQIKNWQIANLELPQAARLILGRDGATRRGAPLRPDRRGVEGGVEGPGITGAVVSGCG